MTKLHKILIAIAGLILIMVIGYYIYLHYFSGKNESSNNDQKNMSGPVVAISNNNITIDTGSEQNNFGISENTSFVEYQTDQSVNKKIGATNISKGDLITIYYDIKNNQKIAIMVFKLQ